MDACIYARTKTQENVGGHMITQKPTPEMMVMNGKVMKFDRYFTSRLATSIDPMSGCSDTRRTEVEPKCRLKVTVCRSHQVVMVSLATSLATDS